MAKIIQLTEWLDLHLPRDPTTFQGWNITPINGGNNLVYRAALDHQTFAIKFSLRDDRERAFREYLALQALEEAGASIAPRGLWYDADKFGYSVVVQSWVDGAPLLSPPRSLEQWTSFVEHYCSIHAVSQNRTKLPIKRANLNARSGEEGKEVVSRQVAFLPESAFSNRVRSLLDLFYAWSPPTWEDSPLRLCRADGNWNNFIQGSNWLYSVDWEYSGWGDPVFEWADIKTHPAYEDMIVDWGGLIGHYADRMNDATASLRVQVYELVMLMWWVVRWNRYVYEIPRGLNPKRLTNRQDKWLSDHASQLEKYLIRAEQYLAQIDNFRSIG